MSTFLELSKDTRRECGIPGTGPAAVTGQTGELERIVKWVADAYTEIQNRHVDWRWLRKTFTITTAADDDTYAYGDAIDIITTNAIDRFSYWRLMDRHDPSKIYLQSAGKGAERWLTYLDWSAFKTIYKIGTQNSGPPVHVTIDPDNNVVLGPEPNDIYIMTGDYQRSAQVMTDDADVPEMPPQFHKLIVYEGMKHYGYLESAQEVLSRADRYGNKLMTQLEVNQLPKTRKGKPLA